MSDTNSPSSATSASTSTRLLAMYTGLFLLMFAGIIDFGVYHYVTLRNMQNFTFYEAGGVVIALLTHIFDFHRSGYPSDAPGCICAQNCNSY